METADFRADYRKRAIGPRYSGWLHFAFTTIACLAAIAFALSRVNHASVLELCTVPIAFLVANVVEYFGHQGPMHRAAPGLRLIFQRHTLDHHHFFTHQSMSCESSRDFQIMLFPPILLIFFFGAIAGPLAAALFFLVSANAGWLFLAVGMGYFLTYEWLHFAYHLAPDSRVGRLWLVSVLRRHHATHHDLSKMGRYNFNITFPICDWVFRTTYRPE